MVIAQTQLGLPPSSRPNPEPAFDAVTAPHTLVVGARGSGRSCVVIQSARVMQQSLLDGGDFGAVSAHAADLPRTGTLCDRVHGWISTKLSVPADRAHLDHALREGRMTLVLDGIDELDRYRRGEIEAELESAIAAGDIARTVITCDEPAVAALLAHSPSIISPSPMTGAQVASQLRQAAVSGGAETIQVRPDVLRRIMHVTVGNPLLVRLAIQDQLSTGLVPSDRDVLLERCFERSLAALGCADHSRLDDLRRDCLDLAAHLVRTGSRAAACTEMGASLAMVVASSDAGPGGPHAHALSSPLLLEVSPGRFGFAHRLIAEFCAGMRLRDDAEAIRDMVRATGAGNAVAFALRLSSDLVAGCVAVAQECGLEDLRRLGRQLADLGPEPLDAAYSAIVAGVRGALRPDASGDLVASLSDAGPEFFDLQDDDADLITRWDELARSAATGTARGGELESFMDDYFSCFFRVEERNYQTALGEFDLLLEQQVNTPFWAAYGSDIAVECKNWQALVPLEKLSFFEQKVAKAGLKLGFFVAPGGVTAFAERSLTPGHGPLIVLLTAREIRDSLTGGGPTADFFRRLVRDTKLRHSVHRVQR